MDQRSGGTASSARTCAETTPPSAISARKVGSPRPRPVDARGPRPPLPSSTVGSGELSSSPARVGSGAGVAVGGRAVGGALGRADGDADGGADGVRDGVGATERLGVGAGDGETLGVGVAEGFGVALAVGRAVVRVGDGVGLVGLDTTTVPRIPEAGAPCVLQ